MMGNNLISTCYALIKRDGLFKSKAQSITFIENYPNGNLVYTDKKFKKWFDTFYFDELGIVKQERMTIKSGKTVIKWSRGSTVFKQLDLF